MKEIWKILKVGQREYLIGNQGNIRRIAGQKYQRDHLGKIVSAPIPPKVLAGIKLSQKGYKRVNLGGTVYFVHRIIATAWIPNPDQKPQINHKNGIKTDNRIENLEWVTNAENRAHGVRLGFCYGPNYGRKKRLPLAGGML